MSLLKTKSQALLVRKRLNTRTCTRIYGKLRTLLCLWISAYIFNDTLCFGVSPFEAFRAVKLINNSLRLIVEF